MTLHLFVQLIILAMYALAICLTIFLIASFTYFPMRDNYRECGTIFLCKNQQ